MIKSIFEFLLWDNCNNSCKFCFQRKDPRIFCIDLQKQILDNVICFLQSDLYDKGNHVLFVGGELFDDIRRKEMLIEFFSTIVKMQKTDIIDLMYVNTNLIYDDKCRHMLEDILTVIDSNNLLLRLKFTTSYDLDGRFKTDLSKLQFFVNIHELKEKFKDLKIVTNVILSKQFCESILENKFDLFKFMNENNTYVNLIPYIILDDSLSPERRLVFDAILKLYEINPTYVINWLKNTRLRQPRRLLYWKYNTFNNCECPLANCGHSDNFKLYSKHNTCFVCDLMLRFNSILD